MTKLHRLEHFIGRLGKFLNDESKQFNSKQIHKEIGGLLNQCLSEKSPKTEINEYFNELFCGLDKVTSTTRRNYYIHPLNPENSESDIIDAFDYFYFQGKSTFKLSCDLLQDPRVKQTEHFSRAIEQGGTILNNWTLQQRELFQLHIANKLWILNKKKEAREKLLKDYDLFWNSILQNESKQLNEIDLVKLCRALVGTRAVDFGQIISNTKSNWRSIYVLWQQLLVTKTNFNGAVDVTDENLWKALMHIYPNQKLLQLPGLLNFVPTNAQTAPTQIRNKLLQYAKEHKDEKLLYILHRGCSNKGISAEYSIETARLLPQ